MMASLCIQNKNSNNNKTITILWLLKFITGAWIILNYVLEPHI